jgi:xanthine dehydrogenase accessory factor
MKELEQILQLWSQAENTGEAAVLATVVKTQGSSYRLPGARMLLTGDGRRAGSVSGGCLEEDLIRKARWLTENGPAVRRYDTTPDGEIAAEYGLGCNGIIHVLLERLIPGGARILDVIREVRSERRCGAIAHLIGPTRVVGQRLIIDAHGNITHNFSSTELARIVAPEAEKARLKGGSYVTRVNSDCEVFMETVAPAVRLLVFGAGDDAVPLVNLAKYLGWQVSVFDGRAHYARRDKFPTADEVVVRPAGQSYMATEIDPWTVAVLMSHSYSQDLENLREFAAWPLPYLGILGPRKRTSQLLADAGLAASRVPSALHSPMGLDIGADGPEQVALAVIAEIQAALNGRQGGLLRESAGSIHAPDDNPSDPDPARAWVQSIACA